MAARSLRREGRLAVGGPGGWRFHCDPGRTLTLCQSIDFSQPGLSFLLSVLGGAFESSLDRIVFRGRPSAREFPATGFAPWGGSISFDRDAPWHFEEREDVPADRIDFLSIAIHELGHVLGIGTAESWGTLTPGEAFIGAEASAAAGGPVPLADDLAHWPDGTMSHLRNVAATAAFTRRIMLGERRELTELDLSALADIGWTRSPSEGAVAHASYYRRPLRGDVDGNAVVDAHDLEALIEHLAAPDVSEVAGADIHPLDAKLRPAGDGVIDAQDLAALRRAAALAEDAEDGVLGPAQGEVMLLIQAGPHWRELPGLGELVALLLRDDIAAARLLGWNAHPLEWPPEIVPDAPPLAGDLDGDGRISRADVARLEAYFAPRLSAQAQQAADVAPMQDGNAIGDGKLDASDVRILRRAVAEADIDGDGLPTRVENETNRTWLALVGRPRHQPLVRWSDECLDYQEPPEATAVAHFALDARARTPETLTEDLILAFCRRDGSAWSETPAISPEEARQLIDRLRELGKERGPDPDGETDEPRVQERRSQPATQRPVNPTAQNRAPEDGVAQDVAPPKRSNPPGVAPLGLAAGRPSPEAQPQTTRRAPAVLLSLEQPPAAPGKPSAEAGLALRRSKRASNSRPRQRRLLRHAPLARRPPPPARRGDRACQPKRAAWTRPPRALQHRLPRRVRRAEAGCAGWARSARGLALRWSSRGGHCCAGSWARAEVTFGPLASLSRATISRRSGRRARGPRDSRRRLLMQNRIDRREQRRQSVAGFSAALVLALGLGMPTALPASAEDAPSLRERIQNLRNAGIKQNDPHTARLKARTRTRRGARCQTWSRAPPPDCP